MAKKFEVNLHRFDPYKNFKFLVKFVGSSEAVAGVSKVSALKRTTEIIEHREGGDLSHTRKSPGQTKFEPITLERGVTHNREFELWANTIWSYEATAAGGAEMSLKDFRRHLLIELLNEAGQTALVYKVYNAWVSEFTALPELDASANAVAIQTLVLQNEGWERDLNSPEPSEPVVTLQ